MPAGESVQSGATFTCRRRWAGRPSRRVISARAAVPTSRTICPPLPTTIAFWVSRSTRMVASMTTSPASARSSQFSTTTAVA